jgi:mRNA interferase MazF
MSHDNQNYSGDIFRWCTRRAPDKRRPVLILTRDSAIAKLTGSTVAPVTTTIRMSATQVLLSPEDDGVLHTSVVNLDNIQTIEKSTIDSRITTLSPARMREVEESLCFAVGIRWMTP